MRFNENANSTFQFNARNITVKFSPDREQCEEACEKSYCEN